MNSWIIQNRFSRPFAAALIALVAFAVLSSPILTAYAAAPVNAISYQGRLLDSSGNPVSDASAEFVFRLFDSASGGTCLWESDDGAACDDPDETQTVAINDGLFSENIGSSVDPDGLSEAYPVDLSGVFENNSAVYLEVVINGETLSPRKQIVAAPFALNSQSLDGLDSTAFLSSTGDTASGAFDFTGATIAGTSALSFEGATTDGFQTTLSFADPTADNTVTFQNASGTVALTSDIPAGSSLWETGAFGTYEDDANVIVGTSGDETISNAAFTLSGNDLFVADTLGVEGSVYSDGAFVAGTTSYGNGDISTTGGQNVSLTPSGGIVDVIGTTIRGSGALEIKSQSANLSLNADGGDIVIGDDPSDKFMRFGGNGMRQIEIGTNAGAGYTNVHSGTNGTLLDSTGAITIDSADWDVSATGNMTGIGSIFSDGLITANAGIATSAATSLSIVSGTTGTMTLDSGTTGTVNIGTGDGGKAINIGTDNTVGNAIAVGAPNGTLDMYGTMTMNGPVLVNGNFEVTGGGATATIQTPFVANGDVTMNNVGANAILIGSAADTVTLASDALSLTDDNWSVTAAGVAKFVSIGAGGTAGTGSFTTLSATDDVTLFSAADFDQSGSTGTFKTGTGSVTLNGNVNVVSGKTLSLADLASTMLKTNGSGTLVAATSGTDYLSGSLADNKVLIGNGAGLATAVTLSGDVTSTNAGVLTIGSGKVNSDKVLDDSIMNADINSAAAIALSKLASGSSIVTSLAPPSGSSANGGSIAANVLTLSLADGTNPGVVSTGSQTFAGDKTFAGTLTANGVVALGDNGDTVAINSSDWDVDATGAMSGIATVASNENQGVLFANVPITGTDATLHSVGLQIDGNSGVLVTATGDGAGGVGDRIVDIGKSGGTDTVNVGDATSSISIGAVGANVALTDTQWSITGAGAGSFSSLSLGGNLDMTNNLILNVGNANTDFTAGGGLTIADDLSVGGTAPSSSPFGVDESANTIYIGEGANGNGTLTFKASDADTGNVAYTTDDLWAFTGGNVFIGGTSVGSVKSTFVPNGDDLYVAGDIAAQSNMYADSFTAGDASTVYANGSITTTEFGMVNNMDVTGGVDTYTYSIQIDGNTALSVAATGTGGGFVGARTIQLGVSAGADSVGIGDSNADVSVTDAQWSVSGAGAASFSSLGMTGNLDMATHTITQIGNAATNFTGTGGLTLAGAFTANGTVDVNALSTFNTDMDFLLAGTENVQLTSTTGASSVNALAIRLENNDAVGAGTQRGMYVTNESNATSATTESLITLDNLDSDTLTDALNISSTGTITDAIDASAANIVNALNVGANTILGTTGVVDYTNFDVASNGNVTVAGGQGIDVNAAGTLALGNVTATTINLGSTAVTRAINVGTGGNADTILIGTGAGADVIGIGASTGTLNLTSGAGVIDFNEFDVSGTTGSVTINDTGEDLGALTVEGTNLDINSLDFVGAGTITTTGGASKLILDSGSGTIFGANGDAFMVSAPPIGADLAILSSPSLVMMGSYDSDATGSFLSSQVSGSIFHKVTDAAGGIPKSELDFDIAGGTAEMTLDYLGNLKAVGGTTFGDASGPDQFAFTTSAATVDAMTLTANSLTSGAGLTIQRAAGGAPFTSTSGLLDVKQLNVNAGSTGYVAQFVNAGTGPSVFVDANGSTGGTVSDTVGGAVHISNTGNADYGLTVYSNQPASTSPLAMFYTDNNSFDTDTVLIKHDRTALTPGSTLDMAALRIQVSDPGDPADNAVNNGGIVIDTDIFDAVHGDNLGSEVFQIRASSGANTVFAVDPDGDFGYDGTAYTSASDLAESYQSTDTLEPGEIVVTGTGTDSIQRTSTSYQNAILGAISTQPGILLGSSGADGAPDTGYMLALAGRVPVKVDDENGPIAIGDPIASSSTAGYGMKSTQAGAIVGFALEAYSGIGPGSISVFVSPQFYVGSVLATDGSATVVSGDLAMASTGTATATASGFDSNAFQLRGSGWDGAAAQNVQMSMATDVTNSSDYRLSIKNTAGSEVAYVSQAGDMAIAGRLYPSDRGTLQTSKYIYYDGSSGSGGDFMRTNASGWATGSYDFAEMFPSVDALEAGDVVMFGTNDESVLKSTGSSASLAGIVSTRPGFLAGENRAGDYPIALAGRVPTKVTLENGSIAVGDPLTASATKGYAMKAVASGPIVGYALEAYSGAAGADDRIIAFVNAGYWSGGPTSPTPGTRNTASTIIVTRNAKNLASLNMEGNVYMAGNDILGVRRIAGLSDRWSLEEDGTVKTEGTFQNVIETYQGDRVATTAVTSPDVQITLVGTATLVNGEAVVRFEDISSSFNDMTSTSAPIRVVVTPNGPVSLYVYEKNNDGFGVRQMNGADSDVTFDWMVSAFRKDFEPAVVPEGALAGEPVEIVAPIVELPVDLIATNPTVVPEPDPGIAEETLSDSSSTTDEASPVSPDTAIPPADSTESNPLVSQP